MLDEQLDRCIMWNLQDAKNRFSAVVEAALAGQPQQVTRRGKPAVMVVSVSEYERLVNAAVHRRGSFVDHLMAAPQGEVEHIEVIPREVEL